MLLDDENFYKGDTWSIGITTLLIIIAGRKTKENKSALEYLLKFLPCESPGLSVKNFMNKAQQLL